MAVSIIPKQHETIVPIANGGTGASDAATAKANLEVSEFIANTAADGTKTLTFTGSCRALLLFYSSNAARMGAYMIAGGTTNTQFAPVVEGTGITITRGTGTITIVTEYTVGMCIIWLSGKSYCTIT